MSALDRLYIGAQIKMMSARDRVKNFLASQDGVSNVVATIVVLLIVVLLIGIFWNRLQEWIGGIMDTIFGTQFDASGLEST
ncbi:MAG: hypothetical protein NC245_17020 [Muribaculum sp.]|nr:hypothetical protein [Muribaculum sp.]